MQKVFGSDFALEALNHQGHLDFSAYTELHDIHVLQQLLINFLHRQ